MLSEYITGYFTLAHQLLSERWWGILFEWSLFILLSIRLRDLLKKYIIPGLQEYIRDLNKKWLSLQEQNAVLVSKKKSMASLFLQQEKQISLLSSKLHNWYEKWSAKERAQQESYQEQAKRVQELIKKQQANHAYQKQVTALFKEISESAREELINKLRTEEKSLYLKDALKKLSELPEEKS